MKSSQTTLIVIGFILLALMATNPSIDDHRQAVMDKMKEQLTSSPNSDSENEWQKAGTAIGMAIGQGIVEKAVSRDNFILFSLTKITFGDKVKNIGIGAFGKVFIEDYEKIKNTLGEDDNSSILKKSFFPIRFEDFHKKLSKYYDNNHAFTKLKDDLKISIFYQLEGSDDIPSNMYILGLEQGREVVGVFMTKGSDGILDAKVSPYLADYHQSEVKVLASASGDIRITYKIVTNNNNLIENEINIKSNEFSKEPAPAY